MFVLVRRVKMPKEFDVAGAARRWANKMPEVIERELAAEMGRASR
jgi:hypothetical protein